jgi:hypothetical protein
MKKTEFVQFRASRVDVQKLTQVAREWKSTKSAVLRTLIDRAAQGQQKSGASSEAA